MDDQTLTQRSIPIEWLRVEVSREMAAKRAYNVEEYVIAKVRQRYAAAGEVPVRIEWKAWREALPGIPELIPNWRPGLAVYREMPNPTHIVCQGRPDLPGTAIHYISTDES